MRKLHDDDRFVITYDETQGMITIIRKDPNSTVLKIVAASSYTVSDCGGTCMSIALEIGNGVFVQDRQNPHVIDVLPGHA